MRRLSALGIGLALGALLVTGGVRVSRQLGARQAYKMATEVKMLHFTYLAKNRHQGQMISSTTQRARRQHGGGPERVRFLCDFNDT